MVERKGDEKIEVVIGLPELREKVPGSDRRQVITPNLPHVFRVDKMAFYDSQHGPNKADGPAVFNNLTVIFAHGIRRNNVWRFGDPGVYGATGQSVVETVKSFNKCAVERPELNFPRIEAAIVCNRREDSDKEVREILPLDIVQIADSTMQAHFWVMDNGTIYGSAFHPQPDGKFVGLDSLMLKRRVKIIGKKHE